MAHTIHLLTAQNSAAKRSVSEVESSSQELLHCSLEFIVTSIDDEFTKQKLSTL